MDVKSSYAAQIYQKARTAAAPSPQPDTTESDLGRFVQSFADTLAKGEQTAKSAMTGGADPHALVEALANSQLAVETVSTVRDKVVEAYQEILRMPI
jgi:flagellar hook-basal body complex protein FliE